MLYDIIWLRKTLYEEFILSQIDKKLKCKLLSYSYHNFFILPLKRTCSLNYCPFVFVSVICFKRCVLCRALYKFLVLIIILYAYMFSLCTRNSAIAFNQYCLWFMILKWHNFLIFFFECPFKLLMKWWFAMFFTARRYGTATTNPRCDQ